MHLIVNIDYATVAVIPLDPDKVDCFNVMLGEESLFHVIHDSTWKRGLSREDVAGKPPRLTVEIVSDYELHAMLDRGVEIIEAQRAEAREEARAILNASVDRALEAEAAE